MPLWPNKLPRHKPWTSGNSFPRHHAAHTCTNYKCTAKIHGAEIDETDTWCCSAVDRRWLSPSRITLAYRNVLDVSKVAEPCHRLSARPSGPPHTQIVPAIQQGAVRRRGALRHFLITSQTLSLVSLTSVKNPSPSSSHQCAHSLCYHWDGLTSFCNVLCGVARTLKRRVCL